MGWSHSSRRGVQKVRNSDWPLKIVLYGVDSKTSLEAQLNTGVRLINKQLYGWTWNPEGSLGIAIDLFEMSFDCKRTVGGLASEVEAAPPDVHFFDSARSNSDRSSKNAWTVRSDEVVAQAVVGGQSLNQWQPANLSPAQLNLNNSL
ncbi:uncharacterized protein PAN0_015c5114 [Moesziomyces antarcticus]|uniref:Uncharacterized protein n=2 Tax=Pseudozyma antarctica TaxID=84753 RepID=A0A081CJP4_PSEA2|nr:uncharacterized protein PAN0_015c5114 [Moesziomyces antarcticus]GAK66890.1 hypothetical protein PAN0_015c5114 [Moesziomyces antarcticus]SPO47940.1 uncharacterized protein PSANT_05628 [Moesziomyces antarcticus]